MLNDLKVNKNKITKHLLHRKRLSNQDLKKVNKVNSY